MDCVERAAQRRFRFFVTIFKFSVVLLNRFANVLLTIKASLLRLCDCTIGGGFYHSYNDSFPSHHHFII